MTLPTLGCHNTKAGTTERWTGFGNSRLSIDSNDAVLTMGYYDRSDLPYYYALVDAFTLCDNYFCSVLGPTDPNRLYTMAASIDPNGKNGGPILETIVTNRAAMYGRLTYTTMPEQLEVRDISWKIYSSPDENILKKLPGSRISAAPERLWTAVPGRLPGGHRER